MGLYDHVVDVPSTPCRKCGQPLDGWQTTDREPRLLEVSYLNCDSFYTYCTGCREWHEYARKPALSIEDFTLGKRNYGYEREGA